MMARGFGTTLGVGATDTVLTVSVTRPTLRSWHVFASFNGGGGATAGRVFQSASPSYELFFYNNPLWAFQRKWSTTDGIWTIPTPSSAMNSYGVSYDGGATSNKPVIYVNGVSQTVTTLSTPVGSLGTTAGGINIGNDPSGTRNWDGIIAELAVWDVILTAAEFVSLSNGYSATLIRPASLVEYVPLVRSNVSSKNAAPTITGTAVRPHPRIIKPKPRTMPWIPAETVSV